MVVRISTQHPKTVVSVSLLTEQHHADASNFDDGLSKEEAYEQVLLQAEGLFDGQRNWRHSNLANTASLLWHAFKSLGEPSNQVNWSGFYLIDTARKERDELILGPFHGKVACQTIALGRGVCGTSAAEKKTVLVKDVEAFPGHIACDSESRSEIVVPIVVGSSESRKLVGIIDIDCAVLNGFDEVDQAYLEKLAALLANSCDWP
ncbi:GAF domain-containing protein [Sporothrix schenckii 1099-18]|uniref:GAF domain-containing protein n=2 Tax=Sporothrix schenckii TaxID=29908 RepID=U7Q3W2_SPOS1|nr:GAF domain-containing protein [Sporothrix schenckii 1099-18]ERT01720.1 hypothetical protein HMPREF1624_00014 [Sporothrix schenckii ATCC 58251]KJR81161.1 GAF domain-containing protein [Sporothrix schenckii 1099-18]